MQTLEYAVQLVAWEVALDNLHAMVRHSGICQVTGELGEVDFAADQASVSGCDLANPAEIDLLEAGGGQTVLAASPPVVVEAFVGHVDAEFATGVAVGPGADHVIFIGSIAVRLAISVGVR